MTPSSETSAGSRPTIVRWWQNEVRGIDYQDVIERVREDAGWSPHFAVMTLLSAGIAILGLLLSSPAVVIGAMLISPLMGPIIGAGFGLATFDSREIRRTLFALLAGTFLAVAFCALIVLLSPIQTVTSEIAARTRPNLFDLLVALLSGLAGTYSMIRGRHGAIVGVAIATALMPPLAVMGFGLATANWTVLRGASLLFFTNLMTIAAAAAALARLYGFATRLSPRQTRLQIAILGGSVLLLAIPLGLSLKKIAWEALATREAKAAIAQAFGSNARVSDVEMQFDASPLRVNATVLTPHYRAVVETSVERALEQRLGEPVSMTIDQVRTSDGETTSIDLAKASAAALQRNADRISRELALLAGVGIDQVLVDANHKTAEVRAAPLPGADLAAYDALEKRLAANESGWRIVLIPPPLPLPSIDDPDSRDKAVDVAGWAALRLGLPVRVTGPRDDSGPIEQKLKDQGVSVLHEDGRRLAIDWQTPAAPGP